MQLLKKIFFITLISLILPQIIAAAVVRLPLSYHLESNVFLKSFDPNSLKYGSDDLPLGFGTIIFRLDISLLNDAENLSLILPNSTFAYKAFLYDGKNNSSTFLQDVGQIGTSPQTSAEIKKRSFMVLPNSLEKGGDYFLLLYFSSYSLNKAKFEGPLYIGPSAELATVFNRSIALDFLFYGLILMMVAYSLSLFLFRLKDKASLCLATLCLLFTIWDLSRRGNLSWFVNQYSLVRAIYIEYLVMALVPPIVICFCYFLLYDKLIKKLIIWHVIFSAILSIVISLSPIDYFRSVVWIFQIYLVLNCAIFSTAVAIYAFRGSRQARISLLGIFIILIGLINDSLAFYYDVAWPNIVHYCFVFFIFTQTQTISYNSAQAYKALANFSINQAVEIETKTKKINDNLKQIKNLMRVILHDISNPLTIALSGVEVALVRLEQNRNLDVKSALEKIRRACLMQGEILTMVREVEAINDGKKNIELVSVSLKDCAEKIVFSFSDRIKNKNLQLKISQDLLEDRYRVLAEPTSLFNNVIANIISNAIKFSSDGGIIEVGVTCSEQEIVLAIKDSGIGIPKDLLDKIFEYTSNTTRTGTSGENGSGYGLPIASTYMKLYRGFIKVESQCKSEVNLTSGTSFYLHFVRCA